MVKVLKCVALSLGLMMATSVVVYFLACYVLYEFPSDMGTWSMSGRYFFALVALVGAYAGAVLGAFKLN